VAAALLVPTLVVLIANHYKSGQQSQALGFLGAAQAIVGVMGSLVSWRWAFVLIVVIAVCVLLLSFKFKPIARDRNINIDWIGAILAALAIILISIGFNNLKAWGILKADPNALQRIAYLLLQRLARQSTS
jgi:hypothetical protein